MKSVPVEGDCDENDLRKGTFCAWSEKEKSGKSGDEEEDELVFARACVFHELRVILTDNQKAGEVL